MLLLAYQALSYRKAVIVLTFTQMSNDVLCSCVCGPPDDYNLVMLSTDDEC